MKQITPIARVALVLGATVYLVVHGHPFFAVFTLLLFPTSSDE